jgi:hypothetical protein
MRRRIGVFVGVAAVAVGLVSCGGDGADSSDPASLTPADVPVYFRAQLRPEGEVKTNTEDLVETISGGRTVRDLIDLAIDEANAESSAEDISFERDIDPWLGDNAGVFISDITGDSAHAAGLIETTDEGATQDFIDKAREKGDQDREYEGVDYLLDDDTAVGVLDGFLVIGDETGFKEAVDVSNGDDSLTGNDDFSSTIDNAPGGSLIDAYVGLDSIIDAIETRGDEQSTRAFRAFFGEGGNSILASVVPKPDAIEIDQLTAADVTFGFKPGDVSELIGSFPADSFAALGLPDVGRSVETAVNQLETVGIPGLSRETIDQQLSAVGLSLDEITSVLGDVGIFAGGTDQQSLEGALVITTTDEQKAKELVAKLTDLAVSSGEPGIKRVSGGTGFQVSDPELGQKPGILLAAGDRIAIGYGTEATEQALSTDGSGATLDGNPTYRQATEALGSDVELTFYAAVPPILELAESLGAGSDSDYQVAKPYLGRFSYFVSGSGTDGDLNLTRVVVGVGK